MYCRSEINCAKTTVYDVYVRHSFTLCHLAFSDPYEQDKNCQQQRQKNRHVLLFTVAYNAKQRYACMSIKTTKITKISQTHIIFKLYRVVSYEQTYQISRQHAEL